MGDRANFILFENRQSQIYFSRWGALDIPATLLAGPEATLAYIRGLTRDDSLLDSVWAEGGVLLDVDEHRLLFWGGVKIDTRPYLRCLFVPLVRLLWPYWFVDWAQFGVADLARAIGWDLSQVYDASLDNPDFLAGECVLLTEEQVVAALSADKTQTALTVRWRNGTVSDYRFALSAELEIPRRNPQSQAADNQKIEVHVLEPVHVLSLGPELLHIMHSQPTMSLPHEGSGECIGCAYVDEQAQAIWVGAYSTLDPRHLEALALRWPGWQLHGHVEGLVRQIILSGRDPAPFRVPQQQAIDELLDELTRNHGVNLAGLVPALHQALPPEDREGMKFGAGFFSADAPPLSPPERRRLLHRILGEALAEQQQQQESGASRDASG